MLTSHPSANELTPTQDSVWRTTLIMRYGIQTEAELRCDTSFALKYLCAQVLLITGPEPRRPNIKRTKADIITSFSRVHQHPVCLFSQLMERPVRSEVGKAAQHKRKALYKRKRKGRNPNCGQWLVYQTYYFYVCEISIWSAFRNIQYAVKKMSFVSRKTNSHFWVYDGGQRAGQSWEVVMVLLRLEAAKTKYSLCRVWKQQQFSWFWWNISFCDSFSCDAATNLRLSSKRKNVFIYWGCQNCLRCRLFFAFDYLHKENLSPLPPLCCCCC